MLLGTKSKDSPAGTYGAVSCRFPSGESKGSELGESGLSFDGKIALVTGAGSGIGRATSLRLAEEGAVVVAADINAAAARETVALIEAAGGPAAVARTLDVAVAADAEAAVKNTVERFGALHLAVNNAGVAGVNLPIGELRTEDWDRLISVNLNGVAYGLRFQIPAIISSGGGAIVNMSSVAGTVALPANPAYTAAKHAVAGLTKAAGADYGRFGVRVNAVGPGFISTPLLSGCPDGITAYLAGKHAMGRLGEAREVAALVTFLLSDDASFITGSYHLVDGGYAAV
jgi:NAD(P)-dependent dehydrogenase (short-subunit alcohol dehydrogenase family)